MESEGLAERGHIEVTPLAGVVRGMEGISEVASDYHHSEVETESYTSTEGYVVEKCRAFQCAAGAVRIVFEQPDVAGIKEQRAVKRADYGEAQLGVEFEFECTCLVEVSVGFCFGRAVAARTEASDGKCSYRVGSAYVKLLAVGDNG